MDEIGNLEALESRHDLSGFECGSEALNSWLRKHALKNQSRNNTRTFVLPTVEKSGRKVIAFYTLVVATIAHEDALQPLREGASPKNPIPAVLLARLGVDKNYKGHGFGKALLKDALRKTLDISRHVGVRAVLVHAKDDEAAQFYKKNADFESSPTDPLHLMLPIQEIAKVFEQVV